MMMMIDKSTFFWLAVGGSMIGYQFGGKLSDFKKTAKKFLQF